MVQHKIEHLKHINEGLRIAMSFEPNKMTRTTS